MASGWTHPLGLADSSPCGDGPGQRKAKSGPSKAQVQSRGRSYPCLRAEGSPGRW